MARKSRDGFDGSPIAPLADPVEDRSPRGQMLNLATDAQDASVRAMRAGFVLPAIGFAAFAVGCVAVATAL